MTINEQVLDSAIRHQVYLLRYSGYVRNQVISLLNNSEEDIARRLRDDLQQNEGLTTTEQWQRLEATLADIDAIRSLSWQDAAQLLLEEMAELAYREPIMLGRIYTAPIPVEVQTVMPSPRMLRSAALSRPFQGRVLRDWVRNMQDSDRVRIRAAVQSGLVAGETSAQIARRVVGTAAVKGSDGVTEMTRRQVQAIVRTAVQHVANGARDLFFEANEDLFSHEQFVATLDSRTTPQCRALDGKRFKVGKGPRPPLHFQCRSVRVAVIDGTFVGDRPANPTTENLLAQQYAEQRGFPNVRKRSDLPYGSKGAFDKWKRRRLRELVGPVPAVETYQTWLSKQTVQFQEEVLGKTKAKLFREGKLPLDRFVDRNGQELTLQQLARKHEEEFRAAGLHPEDF